MAKKRSFFKKRDHLYFSFYTNPSYVQVSTLYNGMFYWLDFTDYLSNYVLHYGEDQLY
jgi:hypothetical protein